ncbi:serine/threonine protein kinase [Chloroflexus sp.]|uniref:serine/threonine protein kinase n=1 Tax=Chloroflexus sp. TaxID=1904827 RepID=UPI002622478E|nr:serine/threonine protein kinase [uncultured Chloroflexus sp.]
MLAIDTLLNGHYRITVALDAYPDAELYRAIDQRSSLRVLITALPQPNQTAVDDVLRLARELAQVQMPGLLALRDYFAIDLVCYLVADDPGGSDLERFARERSAPLPESETLAIVDRLLVVLDRLHHHQPPLLLGDLRTCDLWSSPEGGLSLAPFACARHIGLEATPYRAPELYDHAVEPAQVSDIYAIGAVLYHLLTGWPPPPANQRQAGVPLNAPRALNPQVSVLAEQLTLRALELKPANRYQRVSEMRSALETVRLMAGRPMGAAAPIGQGTASVPLANAPVTSTPSPSSLAPPVSPTPLPPAPPPTPVAAAQTGATATVATPARPFISTSCLLAIVGGLAVAALGMCLLVAVLLALYLTGGSLFGMMGGAVAMEPTVAALPTTQPAATAELLQQVEAITQTAQLREDSLGASAYSPNGQLAAVAVGSAVQLRNAETFVLQMTLTGHTGDVSSLAFSPDGAILASGAQDDPIVRLWDVRNGRELAQLRGHDDWIRSLAFSPDGRLLASGSADRTVRIWDVDRRETLVILRGHTDFLGNIAFSPDGQRLASASRDGTARLWDVVSGRQIDTFRFSAPVDPTSNTPFWLTGIAFSPDGRQIAVGSIDGNIYLLDATSGNVQHELRGHDGWVVIRGVAYSPDGRLLASASLDGSVRLWNPANGSNRGVLRQRGLRLLGLSWSPDGERILASSDMGGNLIVWDVDSTEVVQSFQVTQGIVTGVRYSADGTLLAASGANGAVRVHTLGSDRVLKLDGGAATTQYIDFISDTEVVAISEAGEIVTIDLTNRRPNEQLSGMRGFPLNLAVSPDRNLIAVGNEQGEVYIWETVSRQYLRRLTGLNGPVYTLAFSANGAYLAAVTNQPPDSPQIAVWEMARGGSPVILRGHNGPITGLVFDNNVLISASSDGSVRARDVANNNAEVLQMRIPNDRGWLSCMVVTSDGNLLIAGTISGHLVFYRLSNGELLREIDLAAGAVLAVAVTPDESQLAVSTRDEGILLFDLAPLK